MKANAVTAMSVRELQKEIAALTGRAVVSTDVAYLMQRLAALKRRAEAGIAMPNTPRADPAAAVTVSLTRGRLDLLAHIAVVRKTTVSGVVREAFDEWCAAHGFGRALRDMTEPKRGT